MKPTLIVLLHNSPSLWPYLSLNAPFSLIVSLQKIPFLWSSLCLNFISIVWHVTGTGSGLLGEIPRVVVQKSALL
jgi:hypothetical protein